MDFEGSWLERHHVIIHHCGPHLKCFCSRGMMDENNEQFVAYFLPTAETMGKRKEDEKEGVNYNEEEE